MEKVLKSFENGDKVNLYKILPECGYSKNTAYGHSKDIVNSKGFNQLLAEIDDGRLLKRLRDIALDEKDKRASLSAIQELLKLKNRYPTQKLKIAQYQEELEKITEK